MYVDIHALTDMKILTLDLETLMQLVNKHGETSNRHLSETELRA